MAIDILPATLADVRVMMPTGVAAFSSDPLNRAIENVDKGTPQQRQDYLEWRIARNEKRMTGPGKYWFKAVESDSGAILGYTGIVSPEAESANGLPEGKEPELNPATAAIMNRELYAELERKLGEARERCMGGRKDYWYLASMAVHPDQQRRGIGKRLLQAECELADKAGQDIYLEAIPSGKKLYENAGFDILGEVLMLDESYPLTLMLRRARAAA